MNPFVAIFAWPVFVIFLFQRYKPALALLLSITAGYLLLPEKTELDLPLLPALNKYTIPALVSFMMAFFALRQVGTETYRPGWMPQVWISRALILALLLGAFMTIITNRDPLIYGPKIINGLTFYDAFSNIINAFIVLLPFLLARKFLARPEEHRTFLIILCFAGFVYSFPALYEIRMSPQLNNIVYGIFPHSWIQHIRGNGFRPLVFLEHGLVLGIFLSATVLAALGMVRLEKNSRKGYYIAIALWLFATLFLAKSFGALLITLGLVPVIILLGVRSQLILAAMICGNYSNLPHVAGGWLGASRSRCWNN